MSSDAVGVAYDAHAELYSRLFLGELAADQQFLDHLDRFIDLARPNHGPVLDLGCGPGSVVHRLAQNGMDVAGYDISAGQVAQARDAFPELTFRIGDLGKLDHDDHTITGLVSRYSIIHHDPAHLSLVFEEWSRVLLPGGPVLLAFFGSRFVEDHGSPFDHRVTTAYELDPAMVGEQLRHAGFDVLDSVASPIPPGGRPFDHVTLLAQSVIDT